MAATPIPPKSGDPPEPDQPGAPEGSTEHDACGSFGNRFKAGRWLWLALAATLLWPALAGRLQKPKAEVPYSDFYQWVEAGKVSEVQLHADAVVGSLSAPESIEGESLSEFRSELPKREDPTLLPLLRAHGVQVTAVSDRPSGLWTVLAPLLPWALLIGAWWWLSRRTRNMMAGGNPLLAKLMPKKDRRIEARSIDVSFDDVAGLEGAKRDLQETVAFLREPGRFAALGGRLPRGVLLVGAPGTGKTLLARAVAGEAQVPFFSMAASEFIEMFVGVGASRVRDLFEQAKKAAPAIIFIDEIDAVGRSRGTGMGGGHDEREQTLNQLLAEMDGFDRNDQIVVLAATNRPDVLDAALLRPGRFDRRVVVELPHLQARVAILKLHTRQMPLADDVDLAEMAASTPGFSGAGLASVANEAALAAVRRGGEQVQADDFAAALDKVLLGDRRETRLTASEKRRVAIHEAGHALVAHLTAAAEPPRRISIIPRGMTLGVTQQLANESYLATHSQLSARLSVLMGGYAAEKAQLEEVSSGAENDLKEATRLATKMVANLGMSPRLGPVHYEQHQEHPFLGARIANPSSVSAATVRELEQEARALLREAESEATLLLTREAALLRRLVNALEEHETLEREQIESILGTRPAQADNTLSPRAMISAAAANSRV